MRQLTALVFAGAAICVVSVAAVQSPSRVQESGSRPTQTIWSGVYSEAQAYRGEKVADTTCIGCHGPKLDGGDSGPKLVGETFLANWSSQSVGELFDWLREAMPAEAPGTLSREDAAAVIAYIFKLNKMPAGKVDLPTEREALGRINIVADKPAARVPGPAIARLDGTTIDTTALTERIEALTRAANVHGLTVTIFNDAKMVYSRAFGVADLPAGKPLRTDTEIYGASLSKAVFSVLVMKLVEQGVLDLDKPLQEYVQRAALAEPRHVLARGPERPPLRPALPAHHGAHEHEPHHRPPRLALVRAGPEAAHPLRAR